MAEAVPSLAVLQVISVVPEFIAKAVGSLMVTLAVAVHPFPSVMVTEWLPWAKLSAV